jgi:outer membrane biosynthesis protein TonB
MKLPARSVAWLLPLLLTGCFHFHKTNQNQVQPLAPPIEDAPPPKPVPSPTNLPPPVITVPNQTPAPNADAQPEATPKPPVKRKKPAPPANAAQQASSGSPGVSAIGQLSSGDSSDLRQQTMDSIAATERGLNGITRELSDQEQKTAGQIREFLKQARAALASGDVDGARTLAAKAKVLLGELSQ